MSKIILGLVGTLASGKEEVKKYLTEKYRAEGCRYSTILRDILARVSLSNSRENIQNLSTILRREFGEDLLARAIATDVKQLNSQIVIVEGIRRFSDIVHLKDLPNFFLIAVDANSHIRYERIIKRNENEGDDKKTFEEFLNDHDAEADRQIPEVMKSAKYTIDNSGTFEDLYKQIDEIISKLS